MTRTVDELIAAIGAARKMPYGPAIIETMRSLVAEVDRDQLHEVEAYTLLSLVDAEFWSGHTDDALVTFSRLIRLWDTRPERFDETDSELFFNAFHWIVGGIQDDPGVPAERVTPLVADMERRWAIAGRAPEPVAYERLRWAVRSGAPADEAFEAWRIALSEPEDYCEHCQRTRACIYLIDQGRYDEAVDVATAPGLPAKGCPTEPADLFSVLMTAELERGNAEGAVAAYRELERALPGSRTEMAGAKGRRIAALARGGAAERAIAAIEDAQAVLTHAITEWWRMKFLLDVGAATGILRPGYGDTPLALGGVPAKTLAELDDWVRAEAIALAGRFSARAGNDNLLRQAIARLDSPAPEVRLDFSVLDPTSTEPAERPTSEGPSASTTSGGSDWQAKLAQADQLSDPVAAAVTYQEAARLAEAAGALADAGFALAEAAHNAESARDLSGAAAAYRAGVARLRAGGVDSALLVPVLTAWAAVAVATGESEAVLTELENARQELAEVDWEQLTDPQLQRRRRAEIRRRLADVDDTTARLLAERDQDRSRAIRLAMAAAEAYAGLSATADAAHAFWLAGRLQREAGELTEAIWSLESAIEGFSITRLPRQRGEVGNELVELLRLTGQDEKAEEVLRTLSS